VDALDERWRATTDVILRWLISTEMPLVSAAILATLESGGRPLRAREVADALAVSVDDAMKTLHLLQQSGDVAEEGRHFAPTPKGHQATVSLTSTRRESLAAFVDGLGTRERAQLGGILGKGHLGD
jgi:predicted transcriptional regulator